MVSERELSEMILNLRKLYYMRRPEYAEELAKVYCLVALEGMESKSLGETFKEMLYRELREVISMPDWLRKVVYNESLVLSPDSELLYLLVKCAKDGGLTSGEKVKLKKVMGQIKELDGLWLRVLDKCVGV